MRKTLLSAAALLLLANASFAQVPRRVLLEEFTQASCPPCASLNPAFNQLLFNNMDNIGPIKYQVWWPGYDPMYLQNPTDVDTRVAYYGVSGVPDVVMDGNAKHDSPSEFSATDIENRLRNLSPVSINLTHAYSEDGARVTISAEVTNETEEAIPAGHVLQVVILEDEILFDTPPGTTNETDFYFVMRKMLPSAEGTTLGALEPGQTATIEFDEEIPSYMYDLRELSVAAFVQTSDKSVLQAQYSAPVALPDGLAITDLGLASATVGPAGLCEYTLTPGVTINNASEVAVTSVQVMASFSGGAPIAATYEGEIAPGGSAELIFPTMDLPSGTASLSYMLGDIFTAEGKAVDINNLNNSIPTEVYITSPEATVDSISQGFEMEGTEAYGRDFEHVIFYSPDGVAPNMFSALNGPAIDAGNIGGYAQSTTAVRFRFYDLGNDEELYLYFDKIDLGNAESADLTYDWAYCLYSNSYPDRLEVLASSDCGQSWTSLYNAAGSALATAPTQTASFLPDASDWETQTLSLEDFLGQSEVIVAFKGTSAYGNNLFIDNVRVVPSRAVSSREISADGLRVYPTATSDVLNVVLPEGQRAQGLELLSVSGQRVGQYPASHLEGGQAMSLDVSLLPSGLYLVRVWNGQGSWLARFVKQ